MKFNVSKFASREEIEKLRRDSSQPSLQADLVRAKVHQQVVSCDTGVIR